MSRYMTRRHLAGAGAAMLLLVPGAAGEAKAQELDGELLAACARFLALHAEEAPLRAVMRGPDDAAGEAAYDYCDKNIWDQQHDLADAITCLPARTPEGLHAKARVAEVVFGKGVVQSLDGTFEGEADAHELLAMSLIRDVAGVRKG